MNAQRAPRSPDAAQRNPGAAEKPGSDPVFPGPESVPRTVLDRRASGLLVIEWQDGSFSALPHAWLRARCRCAACAQAARSGAARPLAPVSLTGIRPVADQGLNLVFSDGHGRGIYPWTYLRTLGEEYAASPNH